jgi:hypothetical protein
MTKKSKKVFKNPRLGWIGMVAMGGGASWVNFRDPHHTVGLHVRLP